MMKLVRRTWIVALIAAAAYTAERRIPPHEQVPGQDAQTSLEYRKVMPCVGALVEIRHYYVGEGNTLTLKPATQVVFEILSGRFHVTSVAVNGDHHNGTIWQAEPGETLTFRTLSERAILRATYVTKQ